jgi:hypothetical protein
MTYAASQGSIVLCVRARCTICFFLNCRLLRVLQVFRLFSATHPLDPAICSILTQLTASKQWHSIRSHVLAALQELVDTFPMDYYPQATAADRRHLKEFKQGIQELTAAWQADRVKQAVAPTASSTPQVDSRTDSSRHDSQQGSGLCAAAGPCLQPPAQSTGDAVLVPTALSTDLAVAEGVSSTATAVLMNPLIPADSAMAPHLGRLQVLLILKVLRQLEQQLEHLYDAADAAASSIIRCRCCG